MKKQSPAVCFLAALLLTGCADKNPYTDYRTDQAAEEESAVTETSPRMTTVTTRTEQETTTTTVSEPPFADMIEDETEKGYYCEIYDKLSSGGTTTKFYDIMGEQTLFDDIYYLLYEKESRFFWLKNGYKIDWYKYPAHVIYDYMDGLTLHKQRQMTEELEQAAAELIAQIPEGADDYETVRFVHDYLMDHVEYSYDETDQSTYTIAHTAYGAFVNHKAVCSGYSRAFLYIMNELGMDAGYCFGGAEDQRSHAWNYVRIDGDYYWLDVTWDDQRFTEQPETGRRYDYFLLNDEMFLKSHSLDNRQFFIPRCTSLDLNYYKLMDAFLDEYDFDAFCDVFEAQKDDGVMHVMFRNEEALNAAIADLFTNNGIDEVPAMMGKHWLGYTYNENVNLLIIRFEDAEEPVQTDVPAVT